MPYKNKKRNTGLYDYTHIALRDSSFRPAGVVFKQRFCTLPEKNSCFPFQQHLIAESALYSTKSSAIVILNQGQSEVASVDLYPKTCDFKE